MSRVSEIMLCITHFPKMKNKNTPFVHYKKRHDKNESEQAPAMGKRGGGKVFFGGKPKFVEKEKTFFYFWN